MPDAKLDAALDALGDFADLKSPFFLGHSRGVARLAAEAGTAMGLSEDETSNVRRAGAIHDIGMVGVPSGVWDATEPWTLAQSERARTHPYLSERMFARVGALKSVVACAAQHHERLDGSGYPHGLTASAIGPAARVLAASDCTALRQARPTGPGTRRTPLAATMRRAKGDKARSGRSHAVLPARHRSPPRVVAVAHTAEAVLLAPRGLRKPRMHRSSRSAARRVVPRQLPKTGNPGQRAFEMRTAVDDRRMRSAPRLETANMGTCRGVKAVVTR